jgi:hypothetical protein
VFTIDLRCLRRKLCLPRPERGCRRFHCSSSGVVGVVKAPQAYFLSRCRSVCRALHVCNAACS